MTQLPKYVLCYNREGLPAPVIACTEAPYMIGKVWKFKYDLEFISFMNNHKCFGMCAIPGYRIVITFDGFFTGNKARVEPDLQRRIDRTMVEMCDFYKAEQVDYKQSFYKKFKQL